MIHLYMILPSEYVYSPTEIDIPICLDHEAVLWIGADHGCRVHAVPIGSVNGKTALHLCCRERFLSPLTAMLNVRFGEVDHMADEHLAQTEAALCFQADTMICRDLGHLKERDADFAGVVSGEGPDGTVWERPILQDTRIA